MQYTTAWSLYHTMQCTQIASAYCFKYYSKYWIFQQSISKGLSLWKAFSECHGQDYGGMINRNLTEITVWLSVIIKLIKHRSSSQTSNTRRAYKLVVFNKSFKDSLEFSDKIKILEIKKAINISTVLLQFYWQIKVV